jgi:hypothetical protein
MRREKRAGGRVSSDRDGGEDAGAVVALGPGCRRSPATSVFRNAEHARCEGWGVGGAPHLPSAKHGGMGHAAVGPAEESPATGGNPSRDHRRRCRARRRVHRKDGGVDESDMGERTSDRRQGRQVAESLRNAMLRQIWLVPSLPSPLPDQQPRPCGQMQYGNQVENHLVGELPDLVPKYPLGCQ